MRVTGWTNGSGTYGIRVGPANRDRAFEPAWAAIELEIDAVWHTCSLTRGFWNHCPEIRHPAVRDWLQCHGLIPWPRRQPPAAELTPLGAGRFRLTR